MPSRFPLLRLEDPAGIARYMASSGWLAPGETVVRMARAGEGNMNLVVRVETDRRSVILKQSRPWVEKYPEIGAPADRMLIETAFYEALADHPALAGRMPELLHVDRSHRAALFEDLGAGPDGTSIYADPGRADEVVPSLADWISGLHALSFPDEHRATLANRDLRALNHAHLFVIPFADDSGLDLDAITPGLGAARLRLQTDRPYRQALARLGELYLSDGPCLIHGDLFPGSWMHTPRGVRVIDPEFCFFGPPEYDVGILSAHLLIAGLDPERAASLLAGYVRPPGFSPQLAARFAGMEIMRRLLGVAQLPVNRDLAAKQALLAQSRLLVVAPETSPLGV